MFASVVNTTATANPAQDPLTHNWGSPGQKSAAGCILGFGTLAVLGPRWPRYTTVPTAVESRLESLACGSAESRQTKAVPGFTATEKRLTVHAYVWE